MIDEKLTYSKKQDLLRKTKKDLGKILSELTDLSLNEISIISGPIFKLEFISEIILFGSYQKELSHEVGIIFKKRYKQKVSDVDIAIILEDNVRVKKGEHDIIENIRISVGGYSSANIGKRKFHYLILNKSEYDRGIKEKIDYCIAIKEGIKLYRDPTFLEEK